MLKAKILRNISKEFFDLLGFSNRQFDNLKILNTLYMIAKLIIMLGFEWHSCVLTVKKRHYHHALQRLRFA